MTNFVPLSIKSKYSNFGMIAFDELYEIIKCVAHSSRLLDKHSGTAIRASIKDEKEKNVVSDAYLPAKTIVSIILR